MEWVGVYIIRYFILLCVSVVLITTSIQHHNIHPKISKCVLPITGLAILLSIFTVIEDVGKSAANIPLTTAFAFLGYVLRPSAIFLFILMTDESLSKKGKVLALVPVIVNFIIYLFALFPDTKDAVFFFHPSEDGGIAFGGGPLRYASHIISGLYLAYLVFFAVRRLRSKHIAHFLSTIFCVIFLVSAVVIETFFNADADVFLLNSTIVVSALTYYLHIYTQRSQLDALSGLYNRATYYRDLPHMEKSLSAVIQFDLNGLKYINDTYGHEEGDKAIATVSELIRRYCLSNMYAYRLGGDEFLVLANNAPKEQIEHLVASFSAAIANTTYYCSFGYAYREDKTTPVQDLMREAEKKMYEAKALFYQQAPFERRKPQ